MRTIESSVALSNIRKNRMSTWCGYETDIPGPNPSYASNRLADPLVTVKFDKKFPIDKGSSLYAMGSCFAREIEAAFGRENFNVLSYRKDFFPADLFSGSHEWSPAAFLNRYNTGSMLLEVQRLTDDIVLSDSELIQNQDEKALDLHFTGSCYIGDNRIVAARRRLTYEVGQGILDADIIVFTLGLVEAWFDTECGKYINSSPDLHSLRRSNRFEMHVLGYEDNLRNLEEAYRLLSIKNPRANFVVSVSPVPLQATFTEDDVIVANTYSKSVLRAVANDFCKSKENVLYFPSYEMVLNSDPKLSFKGDRRHVTDPMVSHIIRTFKNIHNLEKFEHKRVIHLVDFTSDQIKVIDQVNSGFEISSGEVFLHPFDGSMERKAQVLFQDISTKNLSLFEADVQVRNKDAKPVSFDVCVQDPNSNVTLRQTSVIAPPMNSVRIVLDLSGISEEKVNIILSTSMKNPEHQASYAWSRFMSPRLIYE